jgi:hypothetical protein
VYCTNSKYSFSSKKKKTASTPLSIFFLATQRVLARFSSCVGEGKKLLHILSSAI